MLFAEISDVVWQALIAAVLAFAIAYMQNKTKLAVDKAAAAAAHVAGVQTTHLAEVKDTIAISTTAAAAQINELASVAVSTHKLVDGQMSALLKAHAEVTRKLANETKSSVDAGKADAAEAKSAEHDERWEKQRLQEIKE